MRLYAISSRCMGWMGNRVRNHVHMKARGQTVEACLTRSIFCVRKLNLLFVFSIIYGVT